MPVGHGEDGLVAFGPDGGKESPDLILGQKGYSTVLPAFNGLGDS